MDKTKKRVLIIVSVIVLVAAACGIFAYSRYSRLHSKDMRFSFDSGAYLRGKEVHREGGETKYILILRQKYLDQEYVIRVGIEGDLDRQEWLYDVLATGKEYRSITYTMELPESLVEELGFENGLNLDVLYQHPEIIEEYLKVWSVTAE